MGSGYIMFGFLVAVFPIMQFFATPILGQLSDRYGRKPVLALSLAGTALGYALFAVGIILRNIPLLFVARALDGITGGNLSVAQAAIADVTSPQDRTKNFGMIGAAFGVGFIIGPFLGGVLADPSVVSWFNAATPFWFAAILASANTAQVLFQFDETNKHIRHFDGRFHAGRRQHRTRLRDAGAAADFPDVVLLQRRVRVLHLVLRRVPDSPVRLQRSAHRQLLRRGRPLRHLHAAGDDAPGRGEVFRGAGAEGVAARRVGR